MKRRCYRFCVLAVLPVLLSGGCREGELLRDMAAFDRAYIPALVLTAEADDSGKAVMAVKDFKLRWFTFKAKYEGRGWDTELGQVEDMIMEADGQVNVGDLKAAHDALEGIRQVMFEIRRGEGMEYFLDYLAEFHGPMEAIVLAVKDKSPDDIGETELQVVRANLFSAAALWEKAETARFDRGGFRMSQSQADKLAACMDRERKALRELESALASGDRRAVVKAALDIEPNFMEAYRLFGRFEGF